MPEWLAMFSDMPCAALVAGIFWMVFRQETFARRMNGFRCPAIENGRRPPMPTPEDGA